MELKVDKTTKGTRILLADTAEHKATIIRKMEDVALKAGYRRIILPIVQFQELFAGKVGDENKKMMFNFKDNGDRDLCLAPEYTAVVQDLALGHFKHARNLKLFYVQECFRGEKPQAGRYRQFTQFGIEVINPTRDYKEDLIQLARTLLTSVILPAKVGWYDNTYLPNLVVNKEVTRGLDYYEQGTGFEISYNLLGAQKQICGGGAYQGGVGFAIGVDRVMMIQEEKT